MKEIFVTEIVAEFQFVNHLKREIYNSWDWRFLLLNNSGFPVNKYHAKSKNENKTQKKALNLFKKAIPSSDNHNQSVNKISVPNEIAK